MSVTAQGRVSDPAPAAPPTPVPALRLHLPTVPEALASLLRTLIVALFLLTFFLQPFLIPSESMEHTLLVGDFLLVNKQIFAPAGRLTRWIMPYRDIRRGDIVVFHHPRPPLLIKRVIGLPGDKIRIDEGHVWVNDQLLTEPYVAFEPAAFNPARDNFPESIYSDPSIDLDWWRQMRHLVHNGELVVPSGEYFVLGDNRNHSDDSRFWGLVPRSAILARPLVVYFSLRRPSTTDIEQAPNDKLAHDRELTAKLADFARWNRIFHVIR